ncbi:MAG: nuclear transport factor 2 family protein, partial [Acidimicrobiia bacterium]
LWRDLFTDDMVFYMEDALLPTTTEPITSSGDDFVEYVSDLLTTAVTVHHGHMPEIEILSDRTAQGVWAMFDHVDDMAKGFAIKGAGHYHEQYARGDDGKWRIHELRLTRIRVDAVEPTSPAIAREWPPAWKRS